MVEDKIITDLDEFLSKESVKDNMRLFAVVYNFCSEHCGKDSHLYVKPINDIAPEVIKLVNEYFELKGALDEETNEIATICAIRKRDVQEVKEYQENK